MENAIWATMYEFPKDGLEEYLTWFHSAYLPAALSRRGYLWAAHYEIKPDVGRVKLREGDGPPLPLDGYAILFGGETTRAFFEPSPRQIHERHDAQARRMMDRRIRPVTYIFTVEWRIEGAESGRSDPSGLPGPFIQMGCFDVSGEDEELGTWYAQERMVLWSRLPGSVGGRKLVAAVGPQRHGVLYDFISMELFRQHFPPINKTERATRMHTYILHPPGSSFWGRRIWPPA